MRYLLIFALSVLSFGQDLTDAQRAEHFKLQARLLGAASNVNLTQLQLQSTPEFKAAQAAGEVFTAAKAAYEAHLEAMCPGSKPDPSFDEPKCKPKAEALTAPSARQSSSPPAPAGSAPPSTPPLSPSPSPAQP